MQKISGQNEHSGVAAVVRAAAGRLGRRYWPTESPGLNPMARLGRPVRREVTQGELVVSRDARLTEAQAFFARYHQGPHRGLSIIGAHAASLSWVYLDIGPRIFCP